VRATRGAASFSIGAMLLLAFLLGQALGLPEVEDPIPDKIGITFPFGFAGACAVLAGFLYLNSPTKRERAVGVGGLIGFCLGWAFYLMSLLVQLVLG
jgi:hypothetical protein